MAIRSLITALGLILVGALLVPTTPAQAHEPPESHATRAAASGSVLGYQCGPGVCVIDPDVPGAQPRQLAAQGRFAGLTADGRTASWVQDGVGLVTAPVAGGPTTTVYTESVGNAPVISPDGTQFLWQMPVPVYGYLYTYRLTLANGELIGVAACACAATHGWAGPAPIAAFPSSDTVSSRICSIGTTAETGTSSSCGAVLAADPAAGLGFPDGTADGQFFVAAANPAKDPYGTVRGPIALYSRATGAKVKNLTSHPTDTTPTLSQEGDRVAFERDGMIMVVDVTTGVERVVGPGVYPSWGGTRSDNPPTTPVTAGATRVKGKVLKVRKGKATVRIKCVGSDRCTGKLTAKRHGKKLAKGHFKVRPGTTKRKAFKLTRRGKHALRARRKIKVHVKVKTSTGTIRKSMKLRR